ncbi:Glutathione S-transferase C-terminal [Nesidiocoris tenuis]|uniref:Glutathione S-transferase C-terminal n=1 Tax=Nesidiocoris tenuis TaxID=355587 RepID=A0ABN7AWG2_9HEMI|nr:Glutathione S-transferase C-terminal [Nesidiocoris tenuis]
MGDLYVTVFDVDEDTLTAPVETAICLLIFSYLDSPSNVKVHLILQESKSDDSHVQLVIDVSKPRFHVVQHIPPPASFCSLPVFNLNDSISCVAGLCSVLRQLIKHSGDRWQHLLGFRGACLVACAEISLWTKFCEVDLISCAKSVLNSCPDASETLPDELARLEAHLSQPIRVHNVRKFKDHRHKYAEGPLFLITDLILAVPVFILLEKLQLWSEPSIPLITQWAQLILEDHEFKRHLKKLSFSSCDRKHNWRLPAVSQISLYKRDPTRYKPRHKIFTQQSDIDSSLDTLSAVDKIPYGDPFGCEIHLPPDIPVPDVPDKRIERKIQQLSNLAKSTLKVARVGDIVVDFCSGSGHLGFILAHCLPQCTIVLLDNKEKSLDRARQRLIELNFSNVYIVQANLDYYIGKFNVGVSLHACGVATDLVIWKCLQNKASIVVCPCCYGGIQQNHVVTYPQSPEYKESGLSERGYIVLGHCADQAGSEQGEKGMQVVDTDRCLLAVSLGYDVTLAKLVPPSCTTRNNLIVAVI